MAALTFCKLPGLSTISGVSRLCVSFTHIQRNNFSIGNNLWLSEKPKRPLNPYAQYVGMVYHDLANKRPGMKTKDLMKVIAHNYKSLSDEQIEAMKMDFNEKLAEYKAELEEWKNSLTPEEKEALSDEAMQKRANKKAAKQKQMVKKLAEEFDKPKRPSSAFMLFANDSVRDPNLSVTEQAKKMGEEWSKLSEKKKQMYEEKANKLMEAYQAQLYKWEMKMIDNGKESVVRKSTLKKAGL